jgi:hypothetical protein
VRAQVSLRVWRVARDPYPDCSFLPTHLRSSKGASIEPTNGGILQIDSFSHLGRSSSETDIWCCMRSFSADLDKSFRPISLFGEMIVLSHIATDSSWWNPFGRHQCSRRCTKPPGVQIQCLRDQIRDPTLIHFSLETRALLLEQFPAHSDDLFFWTSFPAGSGYRTSPESHILPIYPCMHQICYHLLITGIFMLFDCIPVLIHEI